MTALGFAMKTRLTLSLGLAALLHVSLLAADTRSEIMAALDYYADVWDAGEIDAISGYYHQDFVLVNDNGVIPLGQQIDDLKAVAEAGQDRGDLEYSNVTVRELGDDHAMAYGQLSLTFEDGSAIESWFTTVYVKTPFGWKALLTRN